jgi:hypothetical protein
LKGRFKHLLKEAQLFPVTRDPRELKQLLNFNRQLLSYRQTAEWGMRTMQGSFGRLRVPLDINDEMGRQALLETCVRLNNIRARCVGINQIRNVYLPVWRASEDERLWENLGDVLYKDIRTRDRVSRFHLEIVEVEE